MIYNINNNNNNNSNNISISNDNNSRQFKSHTCYNIIYLYIHPSIDPSIYRSFCLYFFLSYSIPSHAMLSHPIQSFVSSSINLYQFLSISINLYLHILIFFQSYSIKRHLQSPRRPGLSTTLLPQTSGGSAQTVDASGLFVSAHAQSCRLRCRTPNRGAKVGDDWTTITIGREPLGLVVVTPSNTLYHVMNMFRSSNHSDKMLCRIRPDIWDCTIWACHNGWRG